MPQRLTRGPRRPFSLASPSSPPRASEARVIRTFVRSLERVAAAPPRPARTDPEAR